MDFIEMESAITKMLSLKLSELRKEIPSIKLIDIINYFNNIVVNNNKIYDLNDVAFYIMNIKINKICEYLNFVEISTVSKSEIKTDLESILEG